MFGIRVIKVRPTDSVIHFNVVGLLRISQFCSSILGQDIPKIAHNQPYISCILQANPSVSII
jgi:hypothetical protein